MVANEPAIPVSSKEVERGKAFVKLGHEREEEVATHSREPAGRWSVSLGRSMGNNSCFCLQPLLYHLLPRLPVLTERELLHCGRCLAG